MLKTIKINYRPVIELSKNSSNEDILLSIIHDDSRFSINEEIEIEYDEEELVNYINLGCGEIGWDGIIYDIIEN